MLRRNSTPSLGWKLPSKPIYQALFTSCIELRTLTERILSPTVRQYLRFRCHHSLDVDSDRLASTQDHTQEPVYHVDSKPDRHSISLVAPHGRPHSDADNFSYQDLYNRSFDSSSVSFHQDAAAASPSEAFPNRSLSLGLPPTPLNPEGASLINLMICCHTCQCSTSQETLRTIYLSTMVSVL